MASCCSSVTTETLSNSSGRSELWNNNIDISRGKAKTPIITDETYQVLHVYVIVCLIVTSVVGIVGNIVNVAVYWRQGLKDSITLGFFALSVSDFILVCMPLVRGILMVAADCYPNSSIDFTAVHYVSSGWGRNFLYSTSCFITTFLSLERCCCIILPFKVQRIFTRKMTGIFLLAITIIHLTCLLCVPLAVQIRWQDAVAAGGGGGGVGSGDVNNNSIISNSSGSTTAARQTLRLWFSEYSEMLELSYVMALSFVVPVGTQVIVTVCAFVMVRGLQKSSEFRARAKTTNKENKHNFSHDHPNGEKDDCDGGGGRGGDGGGGGGGGVSHNNTLSPRDARLVKTMIFLVTIFSACNAPFLVATFAWRLIPDLSVHGVYRNMLTIMFSSVYVIGNLNASANVFVYYESSSKFREIFKQIFCRSRTSVLAKNQKLTER